MIICSPSLAISNDTSGDYHTFIPDKYELIFNNSMCDIAFIVTHQPLMSKLDKLQNYFQSELKFSTYCTYIEDNESLKFYLRDLKTHDVSYALLLHDSFENRNFYDLYVLHKDEVLPNITLEKVISLVRSDFDNMMSKVKILKNIPSKWPHSVKPEDLEYSKINDKLRYYFCLLSDSRTLSIEELNYVNDYLVTRKELLQISKTKNIFEKDNFIQPSKFVFKGPNRTGTVIKLSRAEDYDSEPSLKYTTLDVGFAGSLSPTTSPSIQPFQIQKAKSTSVQNAIIQGTDVFTPKGSKNHHSHSTKKSKKSKSDKSEKKQKKLKRKSDNRDYISPIRPICIAEIKRNKFVYNLEKIDKVLVKTTQMSKLSINYLKATLSNNFSQKVDRSVTIKYFKSSYYKNRMNYVAPMLVVRPLVPLNQNKNVVDLTSASDGDNQNSNKMTNKRKGEIITSSPIKITKLDSSYSFEIVNNPIFTPHKSSPDGLINLFALVLNLVPLKLPIDNGVCTILTNSCVTIQEGIQEPALRNIKINHETCKANGVSEIIANIYSIFNEPEKEVLNISFMKFIWVKYFPQELSNFNLMILFYRFVKLLMLYTMFNKSLVTKKLVIDVIEKIDVIVNFNFKSSVSTFKKRQLSCFSHKFDKYFKEHDQLHVLYSKLSNSKSLVVNSKKLDITIKKKKIEFTVGPLLNYFISSINSIHNKMEPFQIEVVYGAIRTLRFCLRKINLKLVQTSFTKPYLFDFKTKNMDHHCTEVKKEINWLCKELKYYQCVLFTDKHYDFINCILDFSWRLECTIKVNSDPLQPKPICEPLVFHNPMQFVQTFTTFQCPIFIQYHPESELEYLNTCLKTKWIGILHEAFIGSLPEPCGARIIKEINVLLPPTWGLFTFNEAIIESSKMYYERFQKLAETDPSGWYTKFSKTKHCAMNWLIQYQLPVDGLEVLHDYQYVLESKYKYS